MTERDPRNDALVDLLKNLRSRRRLANGAWCPAAGSGNEGIPSEPLPSSLATFTPPSEDVPEAIADALDKLTLIHPPRAPAAPGDELFGQEAPSVPATTRKSIPTQDTPRPRSREDRVAELELLARHARACRRCGLHAQRTQAVFGVGNPDAKLMFVGEGPGRDEDAQGEPFVGRAGLKLNSLIEKLGLKREDVYIGNVVKCRPPENRVPEADEQAACMPYLERQILLIRPRIIICLGLTAAQALLETKSTMALLRKTRHQLGEILVIATYHPAYVLRNPKAAWDVWADVKDVPDLLKS